MANKTINMSKLRQMLRLYAQGESKLKISELTGVLPILAQPTKLVLLLSRE
jgi:hypothetical protein